MNKFFAKYFIYQPVQFLRGERVLKYLSELEKTQWLSTDELNQLSFQKAMSVVREAYNNVPFYKKRFDACKIKPDDIKSINDWKYIPFLTKEDIQNHKDELLSQNSQKMFLIKKTTGGSTGQAVTVFKNPKAAAYARAAMYRGYRWWNVDIGDKQARFWGIPINRNTRIMYSIIDLLMNRKRISAFNFNEESMYSFYKTLTRFRPAYLYGYVSMLAEFANFLKKNNLDVTSLNAKLVVTTSEVLFKDYRNLLENTFKCKVLNEYGCGEVGPIAYECPEGGMHINAENLFLEFIKDGNNEIGEIVITELNNFAMPLIRYRLGDCARPTERLCKCGRGLPLLSDIVGRAYDFIISPDGRRFHGEYIMYLFEDLKNKEMGIKQFQVIQLKRDLIIIKIVKGKDFNNAANHFLEQNLKKTLGDNVKINFEFVLEIPREKSGKIRLIKSNLK